MTDTFSNPHRNEWCSLEREIFCGHLWIILLIRWMRWQDSIPKSLSASHRDHLLPILSMNRKDCIRYSWEVFRMDRRSIKNGWSPVSAAAWIRGKNLMRFQPGAPVYRRQYNRRRNCLWSELPVYGLSGKFLSGKADAVFISPVWDFRKNGGLQLSGADLWERNICGDGGAG